VTKVIEGDGFTLVLSEKLGKIEVKKISKVIDGAAVILVITPADEFFERAFGHKPRLKEKIRFQIVCSAESADLITKGIGIPISEDSNVSSARS
jgi:hypothetical protein